MESLETQMAVLIKSVASLSEVTCNHDILLTKLVDDHEQRIRLLERCALDRGELTDFEKRIRVLENWRWYIIGGIAAILFIIGLVMRFR